MAIKRSRKIKSNRVNRSRKSNRVNRSRKSRISKRVNRSRKPSRINRKKKMQRGGEIDHQIEGFSKEYFLKTDLIIKEIEGKIELGQEFIKSENPSESGTERYQYLHNLTDADINHDLIYKMMTLSFPAALSGPSVDIVPGIVAQRRNLMMEYWVSGDSDEAYKALVETLVIVSYSIANTRNPTPVARSRWSRCSRCSRCISGPDHSLKTGTFRDDFNIWYELVSDGACNEKGKNEVLDQSR